ncbi:MAG TPA: DegT/DnrJ/EryC1/StrS family aminotransferase, partial [Vicinamibacterales bacterium]|nr:DegT/DnrJ/EryC1/StrS family aminotransferase [Vicinamibacterales bacterium]
RFEDRIVASIRIARTAAAKETVCEKTESRTVPFHKPSIGDEEVEAVVETLRSGWLTMGPKTREFEEAFAAEIGARHAVAVNSCTSGLHLALNALGLSPGDEVITSTLTFTASAATIIHAGARPVLVDVVEDSLNLDVEDVARKITPRTRAIVPVHFGGHPADMDRISALAREHGLDVLEDAAHAVPAKYRGRKIGTLSRVTAFSFYTTKNITTGEGGMLTTDDEALADILRVRRLHGMSKDAWKRYTAQGSWRYDVVYPGFKYNTTDVNSALGLVQLRRIYELRDARAAIAKRYAELLRGVDGIDLPAARADVEHAWHLFVVRIRPDRSSISRDAVIEELRQAGIGTSVHFIPLHLHSYYRETFALRPEDFPVATRASEQILSLPLYPDMQPADVEYVAETLARCVRQAARC